MSTQSHYGSTASLYSRPAATSTALARGPTTLKSARLMQQSSAPVSARRSSVAATSATSAQAAVASSSSSSFMTQARRDAQPQAQVSQVPRNHLSSASGRRTLLPNTNLDHKVLLVLDMDETLLHASVQPPPSYDVNFIVPMDTGKVPVYVSFRPHMMDFLRTVARWFEVVVFTASISKYANQVLDYIDPSGRLIHHRLYREHCTECDGTYVKDLSLLNRPMDRLMIVDNSPVAYSFQPQNAMPIVSWFDDKEDNALPEMLPTLERLSRCRSVYDIVDDYKNSLVTRAPVRRYA